MSNQLVKRVFPLMLGAALSAPAAATDQLLTEPSWSSILQLDCQSVLLANGSANYKVVKQTPKTEPEHPELIPEDQREEMIITQGYEGGSRQEFMAFGRLEDGTLRFDFQLVDHKAQVRSSISGKSAFDQLIDFINPSRIDRVMGDWSVGSNNHTQFILNLRSGTSVEQAALSTWSGQQVRRYGFDAVETIWFDYKSDTDLLNSRYNGIEPNLDHFTMDVFFIRNSDMTRKKQFNGPLVSTWSEDEKTVWIYDTLFDFQLGIRVTETGFEILESSRTENEDSFNGPLLQLKQTLLDANSIIESRVGFEPISIELNRSLLRGLAHLRPLGIKTIREDLQLSVIGKLFAKHGLLVESFQNQRLVLR